MSRLLVWHTHVYDIVWYTQVSFIFVTHARFVYLCYTHMFRMMRDTRTSCLHGDTRTSWIMCDHTHMSRLFVWHTHVYMCNPHTSRIMCDNTHLSFYLCDTHTSCLHVWHIHFSYNVWHTHVSFICVTHTRLEYCVTRTCSFICVTRAFMFAWVRHTWCLVQCVTHDDDCFYYHSWKNNVVIAFETLSSFLT